ncbi:MAG: hypothetical protein DRP85_03125 [Candidatus Makaraimicrobium thalassicum]|nr:MAG: hypothetical protein DRP85_03125 [Candidatus Omnitrophota bacterium]
MQRRVGSTLIWSYLDMSVDSLREVNSTTVEDIQMHFGLTAVDSIMVLSEWITDNRSEQDEH